MMKPPLFEHLYICIFFLISPIIGEWWVDATFYIPYCYAIIGLLGISTILRRRIHFSLPDILLAVLLIYNLPAIIKSDSLPTICLFTLIYLLTKRVFQEKKVINRLMNTFIVSGGIQVLICLLQLWGYWESNDPYFRITGTFDNPGLLGGYLSVCLAATLGQYKQMNKWFAYSFITLLTIGVILSDSRAAWFGILTILLYKLAKHLKLSLCKRLLYFSLLGIFVGVISLYIYKSPSANGRLIIWKVCGKMIEDNPFTGHGFASFSQHYMPYQTEYIKQHKDERDSKLLSDNQYAFNELLHITCEQGIVGLFIVLSVIACLIKVHYKSTTENTFFLCFITFLIFSCFSYPCDDFIMFMLLAFIIGGLSASVPPIASMQSRYAKWGLYTVILFTIIVLGKGFIQKLCIEKAVSDFIYKDEYESIDYLQEHFSSFRNSKDIIFRYARALYLKGEYEVGIPIQKQAIKLYPTTSKYCDLGEMYQAMGDTVQAELSYKYASQMLPHLIYPRYCLFLLYKETKREASAYQMALQIIKLTPKVDNQTVRDIKFAIKKHLDNKPAIKESGI